MAGQRSVRRGDPAADPDGGRGPADVRDGLPPVARRLAVGPGGASDARWPAGHARAACRYRAGTATGQCLQPHGRTAAAAAGKPARAGAGRGARGTYPAGADAFRPGRPRGHRAG
ncbi:hypothetical protein G6F40_014953 [Rhizopus arrhizus]|nr:hypothetical protein G6F40_014953 [Rhizopus arrhizus]